MTAKLVTQLGLIASSVSKTARDVYAEETQRMRDRESDGDLTLPDELS